MKSTLKIEANREISSYLAAERIGKSSQNLVVDLDGTLILGDLLFESALKFVKKNPLINSFKILSWLRKGRAILKEELAKSVSLSIEKLPYRKELVHFLKTEKSIDPDLKIYLATASHEIYANQIAEHLGIFEKVLASNKNVNLKGKDKASQLKLIFGDSPFDYIGDSPADLKIWEISKNAGVVGNALAKEVSKITEVNLVFNNYSSLKAFFKAIRPKQWVKNLLIFLPLLMAHKLTDINTWLLATIAFVSFSLTASSVYLLNDLLDIEADRAHLSKKSRPIAAATLSIPKALIGIVVLSALGILVSQMLNIKFQILLVLYLLTTIFYTFKAKQIPILDIQILSSLYTLRILAGGLATSIPVSKWLLVFSIFIFTSLACIKRTTELLKIKDRSETSAKGRGYIIQDIFPVSGFGIASGCISILVLALYVSSAEISKLYPNHQILWLLCPVVLYWISRAWLLTHRGEIDEDPIIFALKDSTSYFVLMICGLIMILSSFETFNF